MLNNQPIAAIYDRPVDVLHVTVGRPQAYEGDGFPYGVEIDYSVETGQPCGAKVIGFQRNGWHERMPELAHFMAKHLPANDRDILDAVKQVV